MIRLGRRASLLLAFYLLTSAATAYAECAWVLWQQQGEISPSGSVSSSDWTWLTAEATSTEAECRQVSARFDATLGPKDADGYSSVTSKGKKVRVRNVCLPDTVDPRGAKGK
jgi:hypothetical protein